MKESLDKISKRSDSARRKIIEIAATDKGCHIGGSLSVTDVLSVVLDFAENRDDTSVVLSKGHAAAGLYANLFAGGVLSFDPAHFYGQRDSHLTGHPSPDVRGVRFATGSLGHGVGYALGHALSQKMKGSPGLGIAICGDGELQEGLTWECFQIAAAKNICNFVVFVDSNGGQNDGFVKDISPSASLAEKFTSFGFLCAVVDGHNIQEIQDALLSSIDSTSPRAIICKTVKGKGVRALEGSAKSHYATIKSELANKWKDEI